VGKMKQVEEIIALFEPAAVSESALTRAIYFDNLYSP